MADGALEAVKHRYDFYRDNYRKVMVGLLVSLILNAVLIAIISYMVTHKPSPSYFATTSDGRVIPLIPLARPNQSDKVVLQWSELAAVSAYSYDFVHYRKQLQEASQYFTPDGWQQFLKALESSNNLQTVLAKKLIVSAVATGAPVMLNQGEINGVYTWRVQIPMQVTYQSASQNIPQAIVITMTIRRMSTLDSPKGIGIAQFVVTSNNNAARQA